MGEREPLRINERVAKAQRDNARRLNDQKLLREYRLVALFPEQPPIRVAYLAVLLDEIARRGLLAEAR